MPKKVLFVILDGVADIGDRTPLHVAGKENLDRLAKNGVSGLIENNISEHPDSGLSTFSLLGYPKSEYPGRGYLEALGIGISPTPGSVYIRANFATVKIEMTLNSKKKFIVVDRRAGRDKSGLYEMSKDIREFFLDGVKVDFYKSVGHRGVVIVNAPQISPNVSDSDPLQEGKEVLDIQPLSPDDASVKTAAALNKFSEETHRILNSHPQNKYRELPANYILLRGASSFKSIRSFKDIYGFTAACVAVSPVVKGIANAAGIFTIEVSGTSGDLKTDLREKTLKALDLLRKYNFVILHIKGCDVASHNKSFDMKRLFIEKIDRDVLRRIIEYTNLEKTLLVVASDHPTSSKTGMHVSGFMPFLIFHKGIKPNFVEKFNEKDCSIGPTINIQSFMEEVIKYI